MYLWTYEQDDKPSYLPVEVALKKYKDDTAAYLISQMRPDRWVLFHFSKFIFLTVKHRIIRSAEKSCNYMNHSTDAWPNCWSSGACYCVIPENIHTSPTKGIFSKTPHPYGILIKLDTFL